VVATRPGSENGLPPADWDCQRIETPRLEVSSTDLRARIADGRPLDYLLTPPVITCIHDGRLYR
jgi:nicotinate-nucleotide adenylyltransferase